MAKRLIRRRVWIKGSAMETDNYSVQVKAMADGRALVLEVARPNQKPISLKIAAESIGGLVAGFLSGAIACAQKTGVSPTQALEGAQRADIKYVTANGLLIRESAERSDAIGLVLQFGLAHIGVALSREALKPLGSALLATSAKKGLPQ
jgi:hypothetical protein